MCRGVGIEQDGTELALLPLEKLHVTVLLVLLSAIDRDGLNPPSLYLLFLWSLIGRTLAPPAPILLSFLLFPLPRRENQRTNRTKPNRNQGGDSNCRCEDPLVPADRGEYKSWTKAHAENKRLIEPYTADAWDTSASSAGDIDVAFLGESLVEEMDGRWLGLEKGEHLQGLAKMFNKRFKRESGSDIEGLALGIAGDTVSYVVLFGSARVVKFRGDGRKTRTNTLFLRSCPVGLESTGGGALAAALFSPLLSFRNSSLLLLLISLSPFPPQCRNIPTPLSLSLKAPNVLWRLLHGELPDGFHPRVWWVSLGMNDLARMQCSEEVVIMGIIRVVEELRIKRPDAKIVIQSMLPMSDFRGGAYPTRLDYKDAFREGPARRGRLGRLVGGVRAVDETHIAHRPNESRMPGGGRKRRALTEVNHRVGASDVRREMRWKKPEGKHAEMTPKKRAELMVRHVEELKRAKEIQEEQDEKDEKVLQKHLRTDRFNPTLQNRNRFKKLDPKMLFLRHTQLPLWPAISAINSALQKFSEHHEKVTFFDATDIFAERIERGSWMLLTDRISHRGHPTEEGFERWEDEVAKKLGTMLEKDRKKREKRDIPSLAATEVTAQVQAPLAEEQPQKIASLPADKKEEREEELSSEEKNESGDENKNNEDNHKEDEEKKDSKGGEEEDAVSVKEEGTLMEVPANKTVIEEEEKEGKEASTKKYTTSQKKKKKKKKTQNKTVIKKSNVTETEEEKEEETSSVKTVISTENKEEEEKDKD